MGETMLMNRDRFGSSHLGVMKGMKSNAWSSSTLHRGVAAVEAQPTDLLSRVKLEKDDQLREKIQSDPCLVNLVILFLALPALNKRCSDSASQRNFLTPNKHVRARIHPNGQPTWAFTP